MTDHELLIEKLYASAVSERALGNMAAAESFAQKAEELARTHNIKPRELSAEEREELARLECEKYWNTLSPTTEVVVELLEPGMRRTVQRVLTMEVALPMLKRGSANLVRLANDTCVIQFYAPDLGKEPLPKPLSPDALQKLRDESKSGSTTQQKVKERSWIIGWF